MFLIIPLFYLVFVNVYTQDTLLSVRSDSIYSQPEDEVYIFDSKIHSPARASMLSAAIPGMGQIYNKKYWKVPIVYVGAATFIYFINYNNDRYKFWREVYYDAKIGGEINEQLIKEQPQYKDFDIGDILENAEKNKESFRKYREYNIMGLAAWYLLNILDANIDAYFLNFDVSRDLTLKVRPHVDNLLLSENIIGVKLSLDYK